MASELKKRKNIKIIMIVISLLLIVSGIIGGYIFYKAKTKPKKDTENNTETVKYSSKYKMNSNSLEDFDLYFLKEENNSKNMVYSPISLKNALSMLSEAAEGNSKGQIDAVLGDYKLKKYTNSANVSFANSFFIRDTYKDSIKENFIKTLKEKYGAEVIYDSFKDPTNINNWVSQKTFNLINNLLDSVSEQDFYLINALAINMEWKNLIQPTKDSNSKGIKYDYENEDFYGWNVHYPHENYWISVDLLGDDIYPSINFENNIKASAVKLAASANRYDIVNVLGESYIRKIVNEEYDRYLSEDMCGFTEAERQNIINKYMEDIDKGYKKVASSTDFRFYVDSDIKVFAKELKEYDGLNLEYIGIMPESLSLSDYIKNINAEKLNETISNLKSIELKSFEDGYITRVTGSIPLFKFDYSLDALSDIKSLGINDIFDPSKANLNNMNNEAYINEVVHKSSIEFSNEGIKAAAATGGGGAGDISCDFEYLFNVPVKDIDLTFDKPYLFLIRDKDTNEVWFMGSVYNPTINNIND